MAAILVKAAALMARCPSCVNECTEVKEKTVLHQAMQPWRIKRGMRFFFCENPDCRVVYFSVEGAVISKGGIRDGSNQALVCHCFGVTLEEAQEDPGLREFVAALTKEGLCACDARNPSGKCCLKDFPEC
jgi:hypothetical protein